MIPQVDNIDIRYPIEISEVIYAKSVTIKEEAPITIGIRNISSKDFGMGAD